MKKYCFIIPFLFSCAEYAMYGDEAPSASMYQDQTALRIDIIPSDASESLLPQSFWIDDEVDWQNLDLSLAPSTTVEGNILGFSIFPYIDISLPGEEVPVEGQVQISMANCINGSIVNSDADGRFSLSIPAGANYQMSVTPLSPQNVPYMVAEGMRFVSAPSPMEINLGEGVPIYGRILDFDDSLIATAQLIDTHTGIKGPQVSIAENGYFQLRAPESRADLTIRVQGGNYSIFPTVDIPIRLQEEDDDGFRLDVEMGDLNVSTVFGRIVDQYGIPYPDRSTIRLDSIELDGSNGQISAETNNDINGNFSTTLLEGRYKVTVIPPYVEEATVSPTSLEIHVDSDRIGLGDIPLPAPISISGVINDQDGFPSVDTTIQFKDINYAQIVHSTSTDENGRFTIKVPPVLMDTSIIPSSTNAAIQNFTTDLNENLTTFEWTLQTGQPISGVVNFDGFSVPFALIEVFQGDNKLATGMTGQNGEFDLQIQVED